MHLHLHHLWNESERGEEKPAFQHYFVSSILKQEIPLHCWLFKLCCLNSEPKNLEVKLTKRGLVNNQLLVLATYFLQFSFKKFSSWNFPCKWFSFDWQQSGAETEMSLSCFPSNQCHWVHSELPGAAEILKTESFALIFPLCQCHQICQPVQDILEWKNCFPSTDRKDLLPLKGGQRVAICSNTLLLFESLQIQNLRWWQIGCHFLCVF